MKKEAESNHKEMFTKDPIVNIYNAGKLAYTGPRSLAAIRHKISPSDIDGFVKSGKLLPPIAKSEFPPSVIPHTCKYTVEYRQ